MKRINNLFKKKILLLWYTVDCNFGDYYIYKTVRQYIEKWGYKCVSMDVGLPYVDIARAARKCDFLWFAGGGIIERGIPNIIKNFRAFHGESNYIKYGITGLSIGEFDYSENKMALKYWMDNASFFYTRDRFSACELNRIVDNSIAINSVDVVFANDVEKKYMHNRAIYKTGINFRELPYPDLSGDFKWNEWKTAINGIKGNKIGIPDQYDISDMVDFKMLSSYSPQNTLEAISKCEVVIAMRLHVVLFAAKMGKIPIPISYCPKVERLADQLGIGGLLLGVNDYDDLEGKLIEAQNNKEKYSDMINHNVIKNEKQAKDLFETVRVYLQKEI